MAVFGQSTEERKKIGTVYFKCEFWCKWAPFRIWYLWVMVVVVARFLSSFDGIVPLRPRENCHPWPKGCWQTFSFGILRKISLEFQLFESFWGSLLKGKFCGWVEILRIFFLVPVRVCFFCVCVCVFLWHNRNDT